MKLRQEEEPKGESHGEKRTDGLELVLIDGEPKYWQREDGTRVCGAKTRDFDPPDCYRRCRQHAIDKDNGRCKRHGGQTPKGVASASWEGQGYSRYLPESLGERMDEFMKDPEISSVREELALADVRLSMKLEELEEGGSRELWDDLKKQVDALDMALQNKDIQTASAALRRIKDVIQKGAEEQERWDEVFHVMEQKRKLAETETKRTKASSNTLTVEEASMLVDFMVNIMQDVVDRYDVPRAALGDIQQATQKLLDT